MAERENSVWGKIRVQLGDVQNFLLNGQYKEAVILDKEILASLVRMQIDQALMVSSNLESDINQLFEGGVISAKSRDTYHGIRAFGELAELGNESSAQDANDSFSMLRDALSEYVEEGPGRNEAVPGEASIAGSSYSEEEGEENTISSSRLRSETARQVGLASRVDAENYGAEAPRLNTEGYASRIREIEREEMEDELGAGIPIRRNSSAKGRSGVGTDRARRLQKSVGSSSSTKRRSGRTTASTARRQRNGRVQNPGTEWDLYSILRIALPVAIVLVLIVILRMFFFSGKKDKVVETTVAVTETTAMVESTEETTVEETTATAKRYFTTTGLRVRTKPSTTDSEVLTVLDSGTELQYKADYNDEWVQITYNGQDAYVSKQYVRSEEVTTQSSTGTNTTASSSATGSTGATTESRAAAATTAQQANGGATTLTVSP
jgi:hypothetical protein